MAIGLRPRSVVCALCLVLVGAGCSSDGSAGTASGGAKAASGASSGAAGLGSEGGAKASEAPPGGAGAKAASGDAAGAPGTAGDAGEVSAGGDASGGGPPPAVDGQSVYALECHGDSKDCNLASVPCFGVGLPSGEAAGWACANRCNSEADCSDAPSGAPARASCVSFSSARHCVLVCENEGQSFDCPSGMACYTPPQSPIGYCLWQ